MTPLTDSLRHLQRIATRMLGLRAVESRVVGISADAHVLLYTRRGHLRPCVENGSGPPNHRLEAITGGLQWPP